MTINLPWMYTRYPDCPDPACVRKDHSRPGTGVHVGADGSVWVD